MREIKFRAWSKRANKIFYNIKIGSELMWDEYEKTHHHMNICIDLEYMQYTGLKDKNGVEIYEGDIVRTPIYGQRDCEVLFSRGCFCLLVDTGIGSNLHHMTDVSMEIIGNIYENPELLK